MENQKNIPVLRFPEFKGFWENKYLGETCIIKTGSKDTQNKVEDGVYPFFVRSDNVQRINSFSFDGEAILTSGDGVGVGKNFHYINGKFDFHQRVYSLRQFKEKYNGKFVFYFFSSNFYDRVIKLSAKNSVDSIRMDMISMMKIDFPSLPEQQKIASFLTSVDTRLTQLKQKKNLLEQYKKGVMQKIFSQEIRFLAVPTTISTGSTDADTVSQTDENMIIANESSDLRQSVTEPVEGTLQEFPEWEKKKLGEIVDFIKNGLSLNQNIEKEGYKVTRIETISDKSINIEKVGFVRTSQDITEYRLLIGDMLFSNINSVAHIGKIAYVDKDYDLYHGMNLLNIRINKEKSNPKFFYYQLTSRQLKKHFEEICNKAVNQASINQTDLKKTKLLFPFLAEQTKIANFLSSLDEKINQCSSQIEKTELWKKGLLQQMFV